MLTNVHSSNSKEYNDLILRSRMIYLVSLMQKYKWVVSNAAVVANTSRTYLHNLIKLYCISPEEYKEPIENPVEMPCQYASYLRSQVKEFIIDLIKRHNGNVVHMANGSGMSRPHLYRILKSYDIDLEDYRDYRLRQPRYSNRGNDEWQKLGNIKYSKALEVNN